MDQNKFGIEIDWIVKNWRGLEWIGVDWNGLEYIRLDLEGIGIYLDRL